jgi:hypothetical protein
MGTLLCAVPEVAGVEAHSPSLSFGSDRVFRHCWSEGELQGRPGDKIIAQTMDLLPQAQYRELRKKLASRPCAKQAGMEEMTKIPEIPVVFRFPYGTCSAEALGALSGLRLPAIQYITTRGNARQSIF